MCLFVLWLGRGGSHNEVEPVPSLVRNDDPPAVVGESGQPTTDSSAGTSQGTTTMAASGGGGGGENSRYPTGAPGNTMTISSVEELRSAFPLPFPVRPPLDIYDTVTLTEEACSGLTAEDAGHLATLLGRTRLAVTCKGGASKAADFVSSEDMARTFLGAEAPSFYIAAWGAGSSSTGWAFKRRLSVFLFAITGGNDGRATYVERTWGQRSPMVWYGDKWTSDLRPVVDLHPMYNKDRFKYLTFKISRIWQRVADDYGGHYDWYARLWDDNYFYEEALHNTLGRLDPGKPQMAGKIGWRYLSDSAVFPFAGGGAGWYLSKAGLAQIGPTIPDAEKWFIEFRRRRDIFLPHDIHDEDVFLTAWFHLKNVTFVNIPGVEHVSPGNRGKQRCMDDKVLYDLRWDPATTVYFNYPATEPQFRIENATYAFTKPVIWHYMSPSRLVRLETLLYPKRKVEFTPPFLRTASDIVKPKKKCYPGTPMPLPMRGQSVFETPLPDPPTQRT